METKLIIFLDEPPPVFGIAISSIESSFNGTKSVEREEKKIKNLLNSTRFFMYNKGFIFNPLFSLHNKKNSNH